VIDFSEPDGGAFVLGDKEDCVPLLHEAITAAGDVRLVILDPLAGISAVGLTAVHRVQVIMRSLRRVARDTGVAIVVIHHLTKAGTVAGSKAVVDAVRSVLVAERTEDGSRVITVDKGNNVEDQGKPIRYRITGTGRGAQIEWLGEETRAERTGGPAQGRVLMVLASSDQPLMGRRSPP
jgi:hypothetical protein